MSVVIGWFLEFVSTSSELSWLWANVKLAPPYEVYFGYD